MINTPDRRNAIELIDEAVTAGACRKDVCDELEISVRTYQRWTVDGEVKADGRPGSIRHEPSNKLTQEERGQIINICNQQEYQSLPPSQIVPLLADKGIYIASESSFYRVLKRAKQLYHRGKARAPRTVAKPKSKTA